MASERPEKYIPVLDDGHVCDSGEQDFLIVRIEPVLHPAEPLVIEVVSAFVHVYPCVVCLPGDALDHILRVRSEIDLIMVVV